MLKSLKLKMEKENFKMVQKTVNLVMAVANDNGNGYAKTYCQFEDGSNNTTITPSLYAPAIGKSIPDLSDVNFKNLNSNMDVIIKSPALKKSSEYLVGEAAATSSNLTDYNVEANTGKATPDMSIIIPATKIAYAALEHVIAQNNGIPKNYLYTFPTRSRKLMTPAITDYYSKHPGQSIYSRQGMLYQPILENNINPNLLLQLLFAKHHYYRYLYNFFTTNKISKTDNPIYSSLTYLSSRAFPILNKHLKSYNIKLQAISSPYRSIPPNHPFDPTKYLYLPDATNPIKRTKISF